MGTRGTIFVFALVLVGCSCHVEAVPADSGPGDAGLRDAGPPAAPFVRGTPRFVEDVAADGLGNVYALDVRGTLWAWSADGTPRFDQLGSTDDGSRHRLVAVDEGVVVTRSDGARRVAPDGRERWSVSLPGACAVGRGNRGAVAVATTGEVVLLEEGSGERRGRLAAPWPCEAVDRLIVAGAQNGAFAVAPPLRVYSEAGALLFSRPIPLAEVHALAVAPDGTLGVAGTYAGFGTEDDFPDLAAAIQYDAVLLIYEADGTPRVAVQLLGPDFEYAYGLAADAESFRMTGHFGEAGGGLDVGAFHLDSVGGRNVFLVDVGLDGAVRDARSIPGQNVVGRAIDRHPTGRWVIGGMLFPGPLEPEGLPPVEGEGFVYLGWE